MSPPFSKGLKATGNGTVRPTEQASDREKEVTPVLRQMLVAVDSSVWSRSAAQHACDVARAIHPRVKTLGFPPTPISVKIPWPFSLRLLAGAPILVLIAMGVMR